MQRRDDLRSLLGNRWVQGVLAGTVAVTVAGSVGRNALKAPAVEVAPAVAGVMTTGALEAPITVSAPLIPVDTALMGTVEEAWRHHAVERESKRLAAEYSQKGYRVSQELALDIHLAALKHEIDPQIAFGLVRAESGFRNQATSPVGAVGLTQLMPRTAAWVEPGVTREELRDPQTNLEIGFRYLRKLLDKYDGNEDLALLAYNRGPGTVDKALRRGMNPDNGYAAFVRGEANHGHKLFTASAPRTTAKKAAPRAGAGKAAAKPAAKKAAVKKPAAKKPTAQKAAVKKPVAKKPVAKKPAPKKAPPRKPAPRKRG